MKKETNIEVLDTKEKVLNKLGIESENELSVESVFRRFISLDARVDKEILGMLLPNIDNFSELVVKQQEFISEMVEKQKHIDEKAIEGFNKTKDIISEIVKANPDMDKDMMIYLVDSLKEMDGFISNHARDSGKRMERLITNGLAIGGVVATAIFAIAYRGGGGGKSV